MAVRPPRCHARRGCWAPVAVDVRAMTDEKNRIMIYASRS
jgi:hypothetical protein